jgi:hypothetical protein
LIDYDGLYGDGEGKVREEVRKVGKVPKVRKVKKAAGIN